MNPPLFDFKIFARPEVEKFLPRLEGQENSRVLVIALTTPDHQEEDKAFLVKILDAVKLTPLTEKVQLLFIDPEEALPLADLARSQSVDTILLFGTEPNLLGIQAQLPLYQFIKLGESSVFLAHSLQAIQAERKDGKKEKAAALWRAFKAKFI